jgi:uncharacterized cupin superfamily protein
VIVNVFDDNWDEQRCGPEYAWSRTGIGRRLGGDLLGASVYELPPDRRSWPYHAHYANEELLIVLAGRPSLRTPTGQCELQPGDALIFRRGPEGAHQLINNSKAPSRFVVISTMRHPEIARYPDSGQLAVFAGAPPVPGERAPIELIFDEATAAAEPER